MLSAAEITRGVQGALGFLRRDPAALLSFDNTMEACLRSFRLMAVTAPFYVVYSLIRYANLTVAIDTGELIAIETMSYVINWLLYPVIFYEVARRRGWLDRYPRYIAALNWTNLPGIVIAIAAIAIKMIVPAARRRHPRDRPAGSVLLLVPGDHAAGARHRLGDVGGAAGGELDPVILPADHRRPLHRRAGRHLGRSAPPSGKAPAAAPSARRACDRARRARRRHRAWSTGRGRRAAGCRPGCAPGCAGTSARRRRCGSARRRA